MASRGFETTRIIASGDFPAAFRGTSLTIPPFTSSRPSRLIPAPRVPPRVCSGGRRPPRPACASPGANPELFLLPPRALRPSSAFRPMCPNILFLSSLGGTRFLNRSKVPSVGISFGMIGTDGENSSPEPGIQYTPALGMSRKNRGISGIDRRAPRIAERNAIFLHLSIRELHKPLYPRGSAVVPYSHTRNCRLTEWTQSISLPAGGRPMNRICKALLVLLLPVFLAAGCTSAAALKNAKTDFAKAKAAGAETKAPYES